MLLVLKFLELIRWKNLLIIVLTQYAARIFLVGKGQAVMEAVLDEKQFLITLCTVLVAAAGYIINDYFDIKIDQVNKPEEVVIGRFIRRRHAMFAHQFLNISAAVISFTISFKVFVINVLAMTLLWVYASVFKKKPFIGNFMVAGLTGASLVVMAVYYTDNDLLINIYALFAFGITLIREIIKDIEDIRGDKKFGSTTLPIIWGIRRTKYLLFIFMFWFVTAVISMGVALQNKKLLIAFVLLGIPFFYMAYRLYFADRKKHFAQLSFWSKVVMILGILSMMFV
ncbi:geranylgeranylglycerol-phosphate geranylgeranyltransferase [Arcticibacterium luteifluviistationis]|uniref:Prenyltransferase n=1 Tax=Arcticibacterium luteifluviistationis TaxID=1784714 RepID=A0A2Z4GC50_9BACT|nr:geranylgeranylglycerol-phosphate geranylgeranyltransferase [Arcticibacterium luteifluviistationis]AWV98796.1 prenyltransferase [Arcticibacterium luteifluviistationis]